MIHAKQHFNKNFTDSILVITIIGNEDGIDEKESLKNIIDIKKAIHTYQKSNNCVDFELSKSIMKAEVFSRNENYDGAMSELNDHFDGDILDLIICGRSVTEDDGSEYYNIGVMIFHKNDFNTGVCSDDKYRNIENKQHQIGYLLDIDLHDYYN